MAMKVGIQLYSVRDEMAKDPVQAIKTVVDMGYRYLEVANHNAVADPGVGFGVGAEEMNTLLRESGSQVVSAHIGPLNDDTLDKVIEYHKAIGNKNLIIPADFFTPENIMEKCAYYSKVGKALKAEGMNLLYHNHFHEFQKFGGKAVLDIICENTDPDVLGFELDTFWVMRGGEDPLEIMDRLGSRLKLVHQKDFSKTAKVQVNLLENVGEDTVLNREFFMGLDMTNVFTEIGTGTMDIQSIINKANELGSVEYIVLEQDQSALPQLESIRVSMEAFRKFSGIAW